MIMIKSTNSPNSIDGSPFDDFGFNYLWRLHGLGKYMPAFRGMCIIKNGFAKYCRAGGFNGVESRIIETLRGIEESLDVPRGTPTMLESYDVLVVGGGHAGNEAAAAAAKAE